MSGADESLVLGCAAKAKAELEVSTRGQAGVRVLGPAPLSVLRVNNNYRYRVTLCAPPGRGMRRLVADVVARYSEDKQFRGVSVYADTNPSD